MKLDSFNHDTAIIVIRSDPVHDDSKLGPISLCGDLTQFFVDLNVGRIGIDVDFNYGTVTPVARATSVAAVSSVRKSPTSAAVATTAAGATLAAVSAVTGVPSARVDFNVGSRERRVATVTGRAHTPAGPSYCRTARPPLGAAAPGPGAAWPFDWRSGRPEFG